MKKYSFFILLIAVLISGCNNTNKVIYLANELLNQDSVKVIIKLNNYLVYSSYLPVSKTSESYKKILIQNEKLSDEQNVVLVELPDLGISKRKSTTLKSFQKILIVLSPELDDKKFINKINQIEVNPKVSIDFR